MIIDLPKKNTRGDVPLFNAKRPMFKLTPVIKGVLLYEMNGMSLVGQVFVSGRTATVSIAESKSFLVVRDGSRARVEPAEGQDMSFTYEIFGNVKKYEYTVYEYAKGEIQPTVSARVTQDPTQDYYYSVYLDEGRNVVRNLLIVAAIGLLV